MRCRLVNMLHDELIFEVRDEDLTFVRSIVQVKKHRQSAIVLSWII